MQSFIWPALLVPEIIRGVPKDPLWTFKRYKKHGLNRLKINEVNHKTILVTNFQLTVCMSLKSVAMYNSMKFQFEFHTALLAHN